MKTLNLNSVTRLLALIVLVACTFLAAPKAHAQYDLNVVSLTTNAIPATTTNSTIRGTIVATHAVDIAVQASFVLGGAGTTAVVLKFDESIDNVNWTAAAVSISITANGTSSVSKVSNFTIGGIGYLRLSSVENPNASAIASLAVKYAQKRVN